MFEIKQNQPKLESNHCKYLIINSAVVLDAIVTSRVRTKDDLVLRQLEEGIFSILKDGKRVVEHLDKLTKEQGYAIILYSSRKEHQIIRTLEELAEACKQEGLNGFPKIPIMIVKDREVYQNVRSSDPKVTEGRSHGIQIAGYSLQSQQETEILNGCSKLLHFSKLEQNRYIVFDNQSSFLEKAKEEGWNIHDTNSTSFNKILYDLYQKSTESYNEKLQENLEEDTKEEDAEVERNIFSTDAVSTSLPSKALDSRPQNSIYLKHETEQKNLVEKLSEAIAKHVSNKIISSLESLKPAHSTSQKLPQMNATMEVDKIDKEEAYSYEFEELKDWSPDNLLPSDSKFEITEGPQIGGSSAILRWFVDEATNSTWVENVHL